MPFKSDAQRKAFYAKRADRELLFREERLARRLAKAAGVHPVETQRITHFKYSPNLAEVNERTGKWGSWCRQVERYSNRRLPQG